VSLIFQGKSGKIRHLRVTDMTAGGFGPEDDRLHTEVVVVLDELDQAAAYGFELKAADPHLPSRLAMLSVLREAYVAGRTVGLAYYIEEGKHKGRLVRVDIGSDVK